MSDRREEPAAPAARAALAEDVKAAALALGFDVVGISRAEASEGTRALRPWLERGFGGEMHYLDRRVDEREDPQRLMPGARSVIAVGLDYDVETEPPGPAGGGGDGASGRVARYARGDDYHDVLLDRVRALGEALSQIAGGPVAWRGYVDTGPVQERAFAALGGLGWLGKNTCLIHPELGSYLFLGVLLTDLELPSDTPLADQCGTCTACLDACPTDALVSPGLLDARLCIAYTTIEAAGPVPEALRAEHGDHVFGCDICQAVCPWNTRRGRARPADPLGLRARLAARPEWSAPSLVELLSLDAEAFLARTRRSPVRRAGQAGLLRNALLAAGNSGRAELADHVRPHLDSDEPAVVEHAAWALSRLKGGDVPGA